MYWICIIITGLIITESFWNIGGFTQLMDVEWAVIWWQAANKLEWNAFAKPTDSNVASEPLWKTKENYWVFCSSPFSPLFPLLPLFLILSPASRLTLQFFPCRWVLGRILIIAKSTHLLWHVVHSASLFVPLSVCLSVRLSVCVSVRPSGCIYQHEVSVLFGIGVKVKVKQAHYRPRVTQRVPGS